MSLTMSATALCSGTVHGHYGPRAYTSLRAVSCRQAAHAALEKLDRMSRVHITNPEEPASLCLEIDRDGALTVFVRQEPEELKHDSP